MIFTSLTYLVFLVVVFAAYWSLRRKTLQNLFLLVASYLFYGWIHPWFCLLIAASTVVDYFCGRAMSELPARRKTWLVISLLSNLGMLATFKYFNFFVDNVIQAAGVLGMTLSEPLWRVFLPVGISFYTFQTLSYTIDIYRGKLEPRRDFIDFALFVSFFPQLVAGPIERAVHFLPQIETPRRWDWERFYGAWPLLVQGYLKKMVIADNVAIYVDRIFMLNDPSLWMLFVGSIAFAVQIYGDFSGYTDIARGSARLLGFDLIRNFNAPYLAISPSDFWRRWHISFSTWIRDYLYIGLGGSRVDTTMKFFGVVMISMGLSGLWHGAAWNFIVWGLFHGLLVFGYHRLGMGGRWEPADWPRRITAWVVMSGFTLAGWLIFRASSMAWLLRALGSPRLGLSGEEGLAGLAIAALVLCYSLPLLAFLALERWAPKARPVWALAHGAALVLLVTMARLGGGDFIYFQF